MFISQYDHIRMAEEAASEARTAPLRERIEALDEEVVLVETNEGTYSAHQAHAKMGCGDPHFANRKVWAKVGGETWETGPGADRYPGRMRPVGRKELAQKRRELASLRKDLREIEE